MLNLESIVAEQANANAQKTKVLYASRSLSPNLFEGTSYTVTKAFKKAIAGFSEEEREEASQDLTHYELELVGFNHMIELYKFDNFLSEEDEKQLRAECMASLSGWAVVMREQVKELRQRRWVRVMESKGQSGKGIPFEEAHEYYAKEFFRHYTCRAVEEATGVSDSVVTRLGEGTKVDPNYIKRGQVILLLDSYRNLDIDLWLGGGVVAGKYADARKRNYPKHH